MFEKRIEILPGQTLLLAELAGNALVSGSEEAGVLIRLPEGEEQDLSVEQTETGPAISVRKACEVQVPGSAPVTIRQAQGNLKVKELESLNAEQVRGNLKLGEVKEAVIVEVYGNLRSAEVATLRVASTVYGDAVLSEVEAAELENVHGNLQAKECARLRASSVGGNLMAKEITTLDADQVGGNAMLKEIEAMVTLNQVKGNLLAKELAGGAKVGRIGGNLVLSGDLGAGCTYQFKAGGNAVVRLEDDANAHLSLTAQGQLLSSLPLADEQRSGQTLSGTLGSGGAEVAVEAGGNIVLGSDYGKYGAELGEQISRQVEDSLRAIDLEGIGRQIGEQMDEAMGRLRVKVESMDWERVGPRAQAAVQRAMEKMQRDRERWSEHAARHQERMARRAEREARRAERRERRPDLGGSSASAAAAEGSGAEASAHTPEPGASLDQERLAILRMVEQGQVTPEEAELLMDALE